MRAKKSLGQHFLKSERALKKIVATAELGPNDTVLEIGPGTGTLTEKLLAYGSKLIAVEKDDDLYESLKNKFEKEIAEKKLILVHGDILNFKPESYELKSGGYKLVANIPYNITGAILKKFLSEKNFPGRMVLLVQKEVAERIVARSGKESVLSISVKVYGKPKYIETVKAGSFAPMPKVDSAILLVEDISRQLDNFTEKEFFLVLKEGFKSKRKKLASNLSNLFEKDEILVIFKKLGISEDARAEDLSVDLWEKLAENSAKNRK